MPHTKRLTTGIQDDIEPKRDWAKRAFDLLFTTIGLVILSPFFLPWDPARKIAIERTGILQSKTRW